MKPLKEIVKSIQSVQSELFDKSEKFNIEQAKIQKAIDDFKAKTGILIAEEKLARAYVELGKLSRKQEKAKMELTHYVNEKTGMNIKTKAVMIRPSQFVYGVAQKIIEKEQKAKGNEADKK